MCIMTLGLINSGHQINPRWLKLMRLARSLSLSVPVLTCPSHVCSNIPSAKPVRLSRWRAVELKSNLHDCSIMHMVQPANRTMSLHVVW